MSIAKLRIREGLEAELGDVVEQAMIVIEEGEPAEVIERVSAAAGIDLIVTGIAREGPFASWPVILGRTVERLLRKVSVPILIVRNRPRAPYRHILVTTDFSAASAYALEVALSFFSHQPLHEAELHQFLASMVLPAEARQRLIPLVELGHPAQLVCEYARDRGADLVVLGCASGMRGRKHCSSSVERSGSAIAVEALAASSGEYHFRPTAPNQRNRAPGQ